ncbi:MAG: hypothetical protein PVI38_01755 [Desulfobacterales bacterium]|jgi:hypothetical protein
MLSQNPGWNIEAMDRWLLVYRQGKTVEPNAFDPFFNGSMEIYNHFHN